MLTILPTNFVITADVNNPLHKSFINWLNNKYPDPDEYCDGTENGALYGVYKGKKILWSSIKTIYVSMITYEDWNNCVNTEENFKECSFSIGEEILVGGKKEDINNKRIFLGYIPQSTTPFICVSDGHQEKFKKGEKVDSMSWPYAKPAIIPQSDQELIKEMERRGLIKDGKVLSI